MADSTASMRRRSSYAFLGVLAQGGFRVAVNILIGRFAGAAVLGQSAGILAAAQLLTLMGPTSLSAAQTRFVALGNNDGKGLQEHRAGVVRHVRWRVLSVFMLIVLPLVAGWAIASRAPLQHIALLLALVSGLVSYGLAKSHLLGLGKFGRLAITEIVTAAAGLIAVGLLLGLGVRDVNLLWPVAATAWLCTSFTWISNSQGNSARSLRNEIDKFAALGVVGTLVSAGFMQSSVLIASIYIGGGEAGYYAAAFALATPLSLVTTSIGMVLFPTFSKLSADDDQTRLLLERALNAMTTAVVPGVCVLMFLAPEITRVVWGNEYSPTAVLLPLMICAIGMNGVGMPSSQALTSSGVRGMRSSVSVGVVGASLGILTWFILVPTLGPLGLAAGYLVGTTVTSSMPLVLVGKRLNFAWRIHLLRGWFIPGLVALTSVALVIQDVGVVWRSTCALIAILLWWVLSRSRFTHRHIDN